MRFNQHYGSVYSSRHSSHHGYCHVGRHLCWRSYSVQHRYNHYRHGWSNQIHWNFATIMPQGVAAYDLYIFAPGVTSASQVTLTNSSGGTTSFNFNNPQLKILFPIPTSTVPSPTSTGVRIRLNAANLAAPDTYTVTVTDPTQTVTPGSGPFKFSVVQVRPSVVA